MASSKNSGGISMTAVLFIIFLVLKLTNNIDWSWWWVTSPLWIPFALVFLIFGIIVLVILLAIVFGTPVDDIKSKVDYFRDKYKK